ncbi:MAG TPA: TauD/TfdA family dioxygenase [Polyangia bacterium]|nr:TauD/TfdA family dioxygenase [Polyangia bacterium]
MSTAAFEASADLPTKPLTGGGAEVTFGADVGFIDLTPERLDDATFAALERAVLTHAVVVVRGQEHLSPRAQYELTRRFDPKVTSYGHGNRPDIMKQSVLVQDLVSIPDWPQVKLLGNGRVTDHEGLPPVELHHPSHRSFHLQPLSDEDEASGLTRFYRWHIDAALYDLHPPKVTTLLALKVPEARQETVVYDDGTGDSLDVTLGTTAFVSGAKAYELLAPEQRAWVDKTVARYAPHPYVWMRNARARSNGLGLVSEGRELSRAELPPWEASKITALPLVWKNPLTGQRALQLHAYCVEDLVVDGKPVGDLAECRRLLYEIMRPGIAPSRVYAHAWRDGDLVIFHNRAVWHSVVGSLRPNDVRIYHQCNLAASEPPLGAAALV